MTDVADFLSSAMNRGAGQVFMDCLFAILMEEYAVDNIAQNIIHRNGDLTMLCLSGSGTV